MDVINYTFFLLILHIWKFRCIQADIMSILQKYRKKYQSILEISLLVIYMSIFQILYQYENAKKDFSKISPINTNGSNFTNYNFFDTEKLVDWYYNHRINKYLDFWILQAIKPQKTVFFSIFTCFTSSYWWILTKIWFFFFFIYTKVQLENIG